MQKFFKKSVLALMAVFSFSVIFGCGSTKKVAPAQTQSQDSRRDPKTKAEIESLFDEMKEDEAKKQK